MNSTLCLSKEGGRKMTSNDEKKYKHLSKEEREIIEFMLKDNHSLTDISNVLCRDKTTISKEIKKHRKIKYPDGVSKNWCIYRSKCKKMNCTNQKECFDLLCPFLKKSPYVCNGCQKRIHCRFVKYYYDARISNNDYLDTLSNSRIGIRISKDQEYEIEKVIYDLIINKQQSVNEIYINHPDLLNFSKPTFYSYVNQGVFHLKNIDLRRKVVYKPRVKENKKMRMESKIRINRTHEDFLNFITVHPKFNIVEMDTVEGNKGGKVFLTLLFRNSNLMLIFLLESKTKEEVIKIFDYLKNVLGIVLFRNLFRIILTDNGSEFFDPDAIEKFNNKKCINLFYCDPCSSWQKGTLEKNHEYIRYVLSKGSTFNYLSNTDVKLLVDHINNTPRGVLKNKTPYNVFKETFGINILNIFHIDFIKPDDVNHSPSLLEQHNARKKSLMKLINDLEHYYQAYHIKIDNNIKQQIINNFMNDWYLYTDEDLFFKSKEIIDNLIDKV